MDILELDAFFGKAITPESIKSVLRDIMLKMITEDITFSVDESNIKSMPLSIIRERYPNAIITGSSALKVFGLIDRPIKDFDIMVDEKPLIDIYSGRYDGKEIFGNKRIGFGYINADNCKSIGIVSFLKKIVSPSKTVTVDFFLKDGTEEFITVNYDGFSYKFHNPIQILQKKYLMAFDGNKVSINKHLLDIAKTAKSINK